MQGINVRGAWKRGKEESRINGRYVGGKDIVRKKIRRRIYERKRECTSPEKNWPGAKHWKEKRGGTGKGET